MAAKLLDTKKGGRQFVDRYELIGEIASGGMATVYLSRLTGVGGFQRLYAIKRLHPHLQGEKEFVEMFIDEARLAAGIHHPNVVPILEVGASESGYYLVMEYIEGETLARLLARAAGSKNRIPPAIVVRAGLDMLSGLHAAHELRDESGQLAGVVHRDVSPQNVLVGADGITRITDFGVARAASRLTATRVGQLKGKIAYMAPEQAQGEEQIDRRADVFAAGIVLWEGLAHKRLFKAENEAATLARVISEPIPKLADAAPHVSKPIADAVMRALDRDLNRRYSTCADFAEALEKAALSSQLLASGRDMATYVQQVLGEEMQEQRAAVRAWAAQNEGEVVRHQLTPSNGRTMAAVATETTGDSMSMMRPRSSNAGRIAAVLAVLLLAAGGFWGYRALKNVPPPEQSAVQLTVPDPVPEEEVEPEPAPAAQPSGEPGTTGEGRSLDDLEEAKPDPSPDTTPAGEGTKPKPPASPEPSPDPEPQPKPDPKPKPKPKPDPLDILNTNPYR